MSTAAMKLDENHPAAEVVTRPSLVVGEQTFHSITEAVCQITEAPRPPLAWYLILSVSSTFLGILGLCLIYLITTGVGVWGNHHPVMWAWDIVNFVFWVGIGHA